MNLYSITANQIHDIEEKIYSKIKFTLFLHTALSELVILNNTLPRLNDTDRLW